MVVRILGPVEAEDAGGRLPLGGPKQRLLLAVLALEHPAPVPSVGLADALWGEAVPRTAAKTIQVFIGRLRKRLGQEAIVTRAGGYALTVSEDELDHRRFEHLAAEGVRALGASDPQRARERLGAALGLWRGPALGELPVEGRAAEAVRRLEELRLTGLEKPIEADLALSRQGGSAARRTSPRRPRSSRRCGPSRRRCRCPISGPPCSSTARSSD